jgi:hypothetical protein
MRPLNFTVRSPPQVSAALKTLAAFAPLGLIGCHQAPSQSPVDLLHSLRQCLDAVPKTAQHFVSPCTKLDLTPLNGITRADLLAALGPPTFCTLANVPKGPDCSSHYNTWSFYRLPASTLGGGPELSCELDQAQRCEGVRWVNSE